MNLWLNIERATSMSKDSYYFSHDSNARNDIKMVRVRRALGLEGYGIYFCLIEILREQKDFKLPLTSVSDIAFELHTSEEKVKTIIMAYDLFEIEEDTHFFSARLLRSMLELEAKRQRFINAGKKGGEASVKQRLSNAQPLNKSKINKSKLIDKSKDLFGECEPQIIISEFQKAIERFVDMRKKIKSPLSDEAITMSKKKALLIAKGDEDLAIQILDQSTFNSWRGLFELMQPKDFNKTEGKSTGAKSFLKKHYKNG